MVFIFTKRQKGTTYEQKAALFLKNKGFQLQAKNFMSRYGEIDLIVTRNTLLIFVEVRYRESLDYGSAIDSITPAKQLRIKKTAYYFIKKNKQFLNHYCRFDVIAFDRHNIHWIQNAFL